MTTVLELKKWLNQFNESDDVYIDEGGLTLCDSGGAGYEVGGEPEPEPASTRVLDSNRLTVDVSKIREMMDACLDSQVLQSGPHTARTAECLESSEKDPGNLHAYFEFLDDAAETLLTAYAETQGRKWTGND